MHPFSFLLKLKNVLPIDMRILIKKLAITLWTEAKPLSFAFAFILMTYWCLSFEVGTLLFSPSFCMLIVLSFSPFLFPLHNSLLCSTNIWCFLCSAYPSHYLCTSIATGCPNELLFLCGFSLEFLCILHFYELLYDVLADLHVQIGRLCSNYAIHRTFASVH